MQPKFKAFVKSKKQIYRVSSFIWREDGSLNPSVCLWIGSKSSVFMLDDMVLLPFTGLKDKNGVEWYVDDIGLRDNVQVHIVPNNETYGFSVECKTGFACPWPEDSCPTCAKNAIIIGNRCLNPELLEETK